MNPPVASRHTNWEEYIRDPAYTLENEEMFLGSLRIYLQRGGTIERALGLVTRAEKTPVHPIYDSRGAQ